MYDQTGKTEMTHAHQVRNLRTKLEGVRSLHTKQEVIVGSMGAPGNIEKTHIDKFRSLRTKVRRVLVGSSIQNQNMQYTEMTHIHKFRSLRTKVRSLLVVISNQKQRHAMNLQTAHRRKGSW